MHERVGVAVAEPELGLGAVAQFAVLVLPRPLQRRSELSQAFANLPFDVGELRRHRLVHVGHARSSACGSWARRAA
jgi:hypothetical protein